MFSSAATAQTGSLPYVKSPEETRQFVQKHYQLYRTLGESLNMILRFGKIVYDSPSSQTRTRGAAGSFVDRGSRPETTPERRPQRARASVV